MIPAERTYLNELLTGKKQTVRPKRLPRVAAVLECDPEYLLGQQDTPKKNPEGVGRLRVAGIAEAGAWRTDGAEVEGEYLPIAADPRYPAALQRAYLIRGRHAEWAGIDDGDVVVAIKGAGARDGDVVVVRQTRDEGDSEITIRQVAGDRLVMPWKTPYLDRGGRSEIIARVIYALKSF